MGTQKHRAILACLLTLLATSSMGAAANDTTPHALVESVRLDLSPPPLNHVMSARQIAGLDMAAEQVPTDTVTVRRLRDPVACCGTYIALPWAFKHPSRFWQIFAPFTGACNGMWCTEHSG